MVLVKLGADPIGLVTEARASGGPVTAGRPYLVGERGPKIFNPSQSGTIIPNHAIGGAAPVAISFTLNLGDVHLGSGQDAQGFIQNLKNEMSDFLDEKLRSVGNKIGLQPA